MPLFANHLTVQSPACCALHDPSGGLAFAFGSHHKAGTHLLRATADLILAAILYGEDARKPSKQPSCPGLGTTASNLALSGLVRLDTMRHHCGSLAFFGHAPALDRTLCQLHYNEFTMEDSFVLGHATRAYKLVHMIRDPLSMAISGYWYHLNATNDVPPGGIPPRILQHHSISDGLEMNARAQLSLIRKMVGTAMLLAPDRHRVLTIGMEDFESWTAIAPVLAGFLFEDRALTSRAARSLLAARNPFLSAGHDSHDARVGPRTSLAQAAAAIAAIEGRRTSREFQELRSLRKHLGYVQTHAALDSRAFGAYRYAPSVLRYANGSLRACCQS